MVHLIYFFYTVLNTQTYFAVHGIFYPLLMDLCFHIVLSGLSYRLDLTHIHKNNVKDKYFATVDYYTLKFYIMKIYNSLSA